jgi:rod shape-determining protein MreC
LSSLLATRAARRRGIAFAALLGASLGLMALSSNPYLQELQRGLGFALRPIQGALDDVASGVASVGSAIAEIDRLRLDNQALADEVEGLRNENARLEEVRRQNEELTGLLQLQSGLDFQTTAAQVIGRESSEFRRLVTIDKGTDDGLESGDVVVTQGGALAGRIIDIGPTSSAILLISDTSSTVIGQLADNAAQGTVVGQLGGVLIMSDIDSTERIELGAEVYTAGIELAGGVRSPFPKGLVVGQVVDVRRDANSVVQTAYLTPAANLEKLEYLLVILDYEGGLPPIEEQPAPCGPEGEEGTLPDEERPCLTPSPDALPTPTPRP